MERATGAGSHAFLLFTNMLLGESEERSLWMERNGRASVSMFLKQTVMKNKLLLNLQIIVCVSCIFFLFPSCGDKEKEEAIEDSSFAHILQGIVGKWEGKSSEYDYYGFEIKSDGTGVIWFKEDEEELYLGSLKYKPIVFVTTEGQERLIELNASFVDEKVTTYLSISYLTEEKLIGKMTYFDGDVDLGNSDDWFSVNLDRVDKFIWE